MTECLFVGFVRDGEVAGEKDDAGRIGVGEMNGAEIGKCGHGLTVVVVDLRGRCKS